MSLPYLGAQGQKPEDNCRPVKEVRTKPDQQRITEGASKARNAFRRPQANLIPRREKKYKWAGETAFIRNY